MSVAKNAVVVGYVIRQVDGNGPGPYGLVGALQYDACRGCGMPRYGVTTEGTRKNALVFATREDAERALAGLWEGEAWKCAWYRVRRVVRR